MLEINRNFGQSWYDDQVRPGEPAEMSFAQSSVGVAFYEPVDIYQRNYRAVHYAVLLIVITFLTFFLWEHVSGIPIHGMQYLMVGLALALFYLLLLALSEHMTFDRAYAVSAGALVALITVYLTGVLQAPGLAVAPAPASRRSTPCCTGSCAPRTTRCSWARCCCSESWPR